MISSVEYLPIIRDINDLKKKFSKVRTYRVPTFRYANGRITHLSTSKNFTLDNIEGALSGLSSPFASLESAINQAISDVLGKVNGMYGDFYGKKSLNLKRIRYDKNSHKFTSEQQRIEYSISGIQTALSNISSGFDLLLRPLNDAISDVIGLIPDVSAFSSAFASIATELKPNIQGTAAYNLSNAMNNLSKFKNKFSATKSAFYNIKTQLGNAKEYLNTLSGRFSSIGTQIQAMKNMLDSISSAINIDGYGTTIKKLKFNTKIDGSGRALYFTIRCGLLHDSGSQSTFSYSNVYDAINKLTSLAKSHIQYVMSHASWGSGIVDDWQCAMEHLEWATRLAIGVLGVPINKEVITPSGHSKTAHGLTVNSYSGRFNINEISWATGYIVNPVSYAIAELKKKIDTYKGNLTDLKSNLTTVSNQFNNLNTVFKNLETNFNDIHYNLFSKPNDNAMLYLSNAVSYMEKVVNRLNSLSNTLSGV